MTRYAIDALTAIRLARERIAVPAEHRLVAPKSLQTQALSRLYRAVRLGELTEGEAKTILDGITTMGIRFLGDRVSRAAAWRVADQLGWDDIGDAEFVAVAQLQADALVTLDPELARQVGGIVALTPFEVLLEHGSTHR